MSDVLLDTNAVIWYLTEPAKLSKPAESAIDAAEKNGWIYVSVITLVELIYLVEKSKILVDVLDLLILSLDDVSTATRLADFNRDAADELSNISRSEVPDMPDRMISATARA